MKNIGRNVSPASVLHVLAFVSELYKVLEEGYIKRIDSLLDNEELCALFWPEIDRYAERVVDRSRLTKNNDE